MGFFDDLLGKMRLSSSDDYDEDDYYDDDDDEIYSQPVKASRTTQKRKTTSDYDDDYADEPVAEKRRPVRSSKVVPMRASAGRSTEVCMVMPKGYEDSSEIADILLQGKSVVLNLEGMNIDAAQRIIDFTSGACYTMGGNLQKISKKIFIVTPSSVELSGDFSNILGDSVDLSSLNLSL